MPKNYPTPHDLLLITRDGSRYQITVQKLCKIQCCDLTIFEHFVWIYEKIFFNF